ILIIMREFGNFCFHHKGFKFKHSLNYLVKNDGDTEIVSNFANENHNQAFLSVDFSHLMSENGNLHITVSKYIYQHF
ncbi:MAG: hypothetical protein K2M72_01095, partial [Paramuribaculum sp.]|nr:hypothetical protein [Paramuribaculum sp.]